MKPCHKGSDWTDHLSVIRLLYGYDRLSGPQFISEKSGECWGVRHYPVRSTVDNETPALTHMIAHTRREEDGSTVVDDENHKEWTYASYKMNYLDVARCVTGRNSKGLDRCEPSWPEVKVLTNTHNLSGLSQYMLLPWLHFRNLLHSLSAIGQYN